MKTIITILLACFLVGCGTIWNHVVTLTEVRDSAMKELAKLNAQGKISAATDAKIAKADAVYRAAAEVAQKSLIAYKAGGSQTDYTNALQAVKMAVTGILDLLTPFLTPAEAGTFNNKLAKAHQL